MLKDRFDLDIIVYTGGGQYMLQERQRHLQEVRNILVDKLWRRYIATIPYWGKIWPPGQGNIHKRPCLDHIAIIDLPMLGGGRAGMEEIMKMLGFVPRGSGYLENKSNNFIWMAEEDYEQKPATKILPQFVLADFELKHLTTRHIIERYITQADARRQAACLTLISTESDPEIVADAVYSYLWSRPWPLPTLEDYMAVKQENELLAWVLVRGRMVNHCGIALHLHPNIYTSLEEFNQQLLAQGVVLNNEGGQIRGSAECGIAQSATVGRQLAVPLSEGSVIVADRFVELIWRYPNKLEPYLWTDYSTHFLASNADTIIESLQAA